ncbi:unnamed protein product, partial [Laminaria digitata]
RVPCHSARRRLVCRGIFRFWLSCVVKLQLNVVCAGGDSCGWEIITLCGRSAGMDSRHSAEYGGGVFFLYCQLPFRPLRSVSLLERANAIEALDDRPWQLMYFGAGDPVNSVIFSLAL